MLILCKRMCVYIYIYIGLLRIVQRRRPGPRALRPSDAAKKVCPLNNEYDKQRNNNIHTGIQTYGHTDTQTYRHTDIQTYRHTDIQTYRHTDIQTYRHTDIHMYMYMYMYLYVTRC